MRENGVGVILGLALLAAPALAGARDYGVEDAVHRFVAALDGGSPWEASGSIGAAYATGNSETLTAAGGLKASKTWDPWTLKLQFDFFYGRSNGVEDKNEAIFQERLERQLTEKSWLFQDFLAEHDEQEELDYRLQLTLGYKRLLVKKEKFEMFGEIGGGVLHEEFRTGAETEAIAQLGVNWKWQVTDKLLYTQVFTVYPSLSEFGEYRVYSESIFTLPVSDRIDARLAIVDKYDSAPPAGVRENDLLITFGLQIKLTKPPPKA